MGELGRKGRRERGGGGEVEREMSKGKEKRVGEQRK